MALRLFHYRYVISVLVGPLNRLECHCVLCTSKVKQSKTTQKWKKLRKLKNFLVNSSVLFSSLFLFVKTCLLFFKRNIFNNCNIKTYKDIYFECESPKLRVRVRVCIFSKREKEREKKTFFSLPSIDFQCFFLFSSHRSLYFFSSSFSGSGMTIFNAIDLTIAFCKRLFFLGILSPSPLVLFRLFVTDLLFV